MSALSTVEQSTAEERGQADRGDAEIGARLRELNARYEARFGFRYVVFVAGRPRSAIVPLLEEALTATRDAEMERALRDILSIAADRLAKLRAAEAARPTIGG